MLPCDLVYFYISFQYHVIVFMSTSHDLYYTFMVPTTGPGGPEAPASPESPWRKNEVEDSWY